MKKRFQVLLLAQEYPIEAQVQLVSALVVVHNYIRIFDPRDKELNEKHVLRENSENTMTDIECVRVADKQGKAARCREKIVQAMWKDDEARSHRR